MNSLNLRIAIFILFGFYSSANDTILKHSKHFNVKSLNSNQNIKLKNGFESDWALVKVAVADVVPYPLASLNLSCPVEDLYKKLPYAPNTDLHSCPRLHQLLFNEIVKVKRRKDKEVECEALTFFYHNDQGKRMKIFWMLEDNLLYLKNFEKSGIDLSVIPPPYCCTDFHDCSTKCDNQNILTLSCPYTDSKSGIAYSVGTRFVRDKKRDTKSHYGIVKIDSTTYKQTQELIPKAMAVTDLPKSRQGRIDLFIKLLRKWVTEPSSSKIIPYVWGGSSFTRYSEKNDKLLKTDSIYGKKNKFWIRPQNLDIPHTGFECSSLILRIAQIYGIPYFFKNTTALSENLRPLTKGEKIENGDLIWYPGHVLIASDIKKNLVIESVGYQFGYGYLHERHISKILKNVKSYSELINLYHQKKGIIRITNFGEIARNLPKFVIFKFKSIWELKK